MYCSVQFLLAFRGSGLRVFSVSLVGGFALFQCVKLFSEESSQNFPQCDNRVCFLHLVNSQTIAIKRAPSKHIHKTEKSVAGSNCVYIIYTTPLASVEPKQERNRQRSKAAARLYIIASVSQTYLHVCGTRRGYIGRSSERLTR